MSPEHGEYEVEERARHVIDAIAERRSIRSFTDKPISLDLLKRLIIAAKWAPTGSDRQQWKYIIINDPGTLKKIVMASPLLRGKPSAAILICLEKAVGPASDMGFPAQNIMLAAHALGVGSCAIGAFSPTAMRKILDIPEELVPTLLIALGYAADTPKPWPRRLWSETVFLNSCNSPLEEA
jgi:nitroreductase